MLESTIVSLLSVDSVTSIVGSQIYPDQPQKNTTWPFIVFNARNQQSIINLSGPCGVSTLDLMVVMETTSKAQQQTLSQAVQAILNGYSGLPIQVCKMTDDTVDEIDGENERIYYQETQTYKLVVNL
jgi:hypothetical protein